MLVVPVAQLNTLMSAWLVTLTSRQLLLGCDAGMMPGQQFMSQMHMQHQQHMMPQMHMQQQMGSGAWYPPPGAGVQGMAPGLQGQPQGGPFQGMPMQPAPGLLSAELKAYSIHPSFSHAVAHCSSLT